MTTEEVKLALLKHFRYLNYPMVATECVMSVLDPEESSLCSTFIADVLAIKKDIMVEIEIKQHWWEMGKDLKTKPEKHAFYLRTNDLWDNCYHLWEKDTIRPHKFYFACYVSPENAKKHNATYYCLDIPSPYGLIAVYDMYNCKILKRAKWLHRDLTHLEAAKERMLVRLVKENIHLKQIEYDRKEEMPNNNSLH